MQWSNKLDEIEERCGKLSEQLADPDIVRDRERYQKLTKSLSEITPIVDTYRSWKAANQELDDARSLVESDDAEMVELAREEASELEEKLKQFEAELHVLLLPKDPNDEKGVVLEVRAGTGGQEATLFAAEIFRMYVRYAESQRWKVEITSQSDSEAGGLKEVFALVTGKRVYSRLKYESGVHRVQRVPQTESQGRVHTSAVTVAVMPQAEEVDIHIEPSEIRVDTYCSSGPGGQSVNTTYSAVRITHLPTNLVVTCQDEKSQLKNRKKAMMVLRSRLYEIERAKQHAKQAAQRKGMVGTGDRSEKIRTYNFSQNRVTDHRIGLSLHQLELILEGRIDPLVDGLTEYFQAEQLGGQASAV